MNALPTLQPDPIKPMRVAVYLADQNPHRDRSRGITSMTRTLLDGLSQSEVLEISLVTSKSSFGSSGRSERLHRVPFRTDEVMGRLVCDMMHPLLFRTDAELWYYPKGYLSLLMRPKVPVVGTMHDAIIQHYADQYPQSRSRRAFGFWLSVMKRSLSRLDLVMTVSNHSKAQLERFCDRHSIKAPPIRVTYEGSSWEGYRKHQWKKGNNIVHLASTLPHKRTNHLLKMWKELQQQKFDLPSLTLVGRVDEEGKRRLAELKFAEIVGHLDDAELVEKIGQARALILPSEIEGFGLPALEAYYVGTPACYVAGTSVAEVVTDEGSFGAFELADSRSLYNALNSALAQSKESIQGVSDKLYDQFSNHRCADRVIASFKEIRKTVA